MHERIEAVDAELATLPLGSSPPVLDAEEIALISWSLSEALGEIVKETPTARAKALLRLLIEEIRVVSPLDIRPTYRVPTAPVRMSPAATREEEGEQATVGSRPGGEGAGKDGGAVVFAVSDLEAMVVLARQTANRPAGRVQCSLAMPRRIGRVAVRPT